MSRIIRPTALEYYVRGYLKHHASYKIGKVYLQKALAMVQWKANSPCCDDPDASISLHTHTDNNFTNMVRMLLLNTNKYGNTKSLARTVSLIKNAIQGQCCNDGQLGAPVLSASATSTTTTKLSWSSIAVADSYTLERDVNADFSDATVVYTGPDTSFSDSGLTANTQYYYRVKAAATEYTDSDYGTANVTTSQEIAGVPTSFTATVNGANEIDLTWIAPASGADSYVVQRDINSDYSTATQVYSGADLLFNDTGLTASTQYYYRIKSVKAGNIDSAWVTADATTTA